MRDYSTKQGKIKIKKYLQYSHNFLEIDLSRPNVNMGKSRNT